jgi:protoheme ferro-lyase
LEGKVSLPIPVKWIRTWKLKGEFKESFKTKVSKKLQEHNKVSCNVFSIIVEHSLQEVESQGEATDSSERHGGCKRLYN